MIEQDLIEEKRLFSNVFFDFYDIIYQHIY